MTFQTFHITPFHLFRKKTAFTYIVIVIFLSNCTARFPVSTIHAKDDQTQALILWPEITDDNKNHQVKVTPMENIGEMLLFEVKVTNNSKNSIQINPNQWKLEYFSSYKTKNSQLSEWKNYPMTGKQVNKEYHKIAYKIKAAKDGSVFLAVASIIILIMTISAIKSSNESDNDFDFGFRESLVNIGLDISFGAHNHSFRHPNTRKWTENEKIRFYKQTGMKLANVYNGIQTIPPGETYIYGLFYPRVEAARTIQLNGQVGEESYIWKFEHDGLTFPKVEY